MYFKTQEEIKRRRELAKIDGSKYTNRYAFSGKLYCSLCGSRFVGGDNRKRADGTTRKSWHCYNRHKYGKKRISEAGVTLGCDNEIVSDNALKLVFMDILKQLNLNTEKITNNVAKAISSVIDKRCIEEETKENLIKKKNQLLEEKNKAINLCIKEVITEEELKEQKQFIDNQIADIEKEIKNLENKNETIQNKATILKEIKEVITGIASLETFSDEVCKEIVEKVEVKDKTHFDFYIRGKSGNFFSASEGNILYGKYGQQREQCKVLILQDTYLEPQYLLGLHLKDLGSGGHGSQSQHYAGVAFDAGQTLSNSERNRLRNTASSSGVWSYVEPAYLTPTWVHFDRRFGRPACGTAGYPLIKRGSISTYVLIAQDDLNTLGFRTGGLDGIFGSRTEEAVRSYQRSRGLSQDGIVGCNTWRSLQEDVVGTGRTSTTID